MRNRMSSFTMVFFAIMVMFSLSTSSPVMARQDATPEATPEAAARTEFALVPVGNHPDGFFRDLEVAPGGSIDLSVMVINLGTVPVTLDAYVSNAINTVNGGFTSAPVSDEPFAATTWIDFTAQTIEVAPGAQQEIPFSVHIPEDAEPGQYISAITVETPEALPMTGTSTLDYTLSSSISLGIVVPGEMTHAFTLGEPEILGGNNGHTLNVPVSNEGNYLVRPAGELVVTNEAGESILTSAVQMGSVYAGLSTSLQVSLPEQMPPGDYSVSLSLTDPESGATASIEEATIMVPEPVDPTGIFVTDVAIEPNAEEIVFANVDVTLDNGGQQIPASNVTLEVMRDGEAVESFPLATNQVLLSGENTISARYIPAETWESGEYTFSIVVSAVEPQGGQETILLDEEIDATIVVP